MQTEGAHQKLADSECASLSKASLKCACAGRWCLAVLNTINRCIIQCRSSPPACTLFVSGLAENNYDKAPCESAFEAYKQCKQREVGTHSQSLSNLSNPMSRCRVGACIDRLPVLSWKLLMLAVSATWLSPSSPPAGHEEAAPHRRAQQTGQLLLLSGPGGHDIPTPLQAECGLRDGLRVGQQTGCRAPLEALSLAGAPAGSVCAHRAGHRPPRDHIPAHTLARPALGRAWFRSASPKASAGQPARCRRRAPQVCVGQGLGV